MLLSLIFLAKAKKNASQRIGVSRSEDQAGKGKVKPLGKLWI